MYRTRSIAHYDALRPIGYAPPVDLTAALSNSASEPDEEEAEYGEIRRHILEHLRAAGFAVINDRILVEVSDKRSVRKLHALAVAHQQEKARVVLSPTETSMICRMIRGEELDVARIAPSSG